jgi:hypothetical protein
MMLVNDNYSWRVLQLPEQPAEELLGGPFIAPRLD